MDSVWPKILAFDSEKAVIIKWSRGKIFLEKALEILNVKPLYNKTLPLFCLDTKELVAREVDVPTVRGQNFETTLHFQAEAHIPYPIEEAYIDSLFINKNKNKRRLIFFSARKNRIKELVPQNIEPEAICCTPAALLSLSQYFVFKDENKCLLHLERSGCTLALIHGDTLIAAQSCEGSVKEIERLYLFFKNKFPLHIPPCVVVTGKLSHNDAFVASLKESLNCVITPPELNSKLCIPVAEVQNYAHLIGSSINAFPNSKKQINFLRNENFFSLFKRLRNQIFLYLSTSLLFGTVLFFLFHTLIEATQEQQNERAIAYLLKKSELLNTPVPTLDNALEELENEKPLSYPYALVSSAPNVSMFLSWFEEKVPKEGIEIEKIKYFLTKYPSKKDPKQPYLASVDIEFKAKTLMDAKAFQKTMGEKTDIRLTDLKGRYKMTFSL